MSYATYTTKAIVCGSNVSNTADKSFLLFTEEAGMLWATAKSVREERSRQRHALQDFSKIRVSLLKGKSGWRIGSVEARGNPFMEAKNRADRTKCAHIIKLLRRYVHGEATLTPVFLDVEELLQNTLSPELETTLLLDVFELRLLSTLGYVEKNNNIKNILEAPTVMEAARMCNKEDLVLISRLTEQASKASHL
ncbi:recombination protein O N-terminal domain-containing protein [Candidatus Kaiserbacteria bacterium]|nr:recombination protein O N-terminal domain-containing protein [Candidatus Kaiserbacteria bacterium]